MFKLILFTSIIFVVTADVSEITGTGRKSIAPPFPVNKNPVTQLCLDCICTIRSNCSDNIACAGNVCGRYRISWAYWYDAGKPTLAQDDPDSENAFKNCATNVECSTRAVQQYMSRFEQDCNEDGVINCQDYIAIHVHGGYGCNQPLPEKYKEYAVTCAAQEH